ncbi:hypothetical protein IW138_004829 [Coemansia sp. RSA 986]|nr:hypothetical protein IW138_004829 [Coemansia sp. RSA 986]
MSSFVDGIAADTAVGHSQGVLVASAFAMVTDEAYFYDASKKALGIALIPSTLSQKACPIDDAVDARGTAVKPMGTIPYHFLNAGDMRFPVYASDDQDIRTKRDLTRYLVESVCVLQVNWPQVIHSSAASHTFGFGPGDITGFGYLAYKSIEASGVPVICAGALASDSPLVQVKDRPLFSLNDEKRVCLDPASHTQFNLSTNTYVLNF